MLRQILAPVVSLVLIAAPVAAHAAPSLSGSGEQSEAPQLQDSADSGGAEASAEPRPSAEPQETDAPAQNPTAPTDGTIPVVAGQTAAVEIDAVDDAVSVVGVSWEETGTTPQTVEYRVIEADGSAGAWTELEVLAGDGPDPGTGEAAGARTGTEPVIIADDVDLEVRLDRGDAEVETVTAEVTSADEDLAADADAGVPAPTPSNPTTAAAASAQAAAASGPLTYTTRAQWGADESLKKCEADRTSANKAMVVHHTAGATSYTKAQVPGILRGILKYHTQSLGWCDVGYNMLVDRYGTVYEGRGGGVAQAIVGAHASGFNTGTFGVSVMGTYRSPAPQAAVNALGRIGSWQADLWNYDPTGKVTLTSGGGTSKYKEGKKVSLPRIFGHRETSHTECPGAGLMGQLSSIRTKAKNGRAAFTVPGKIGKFYQKNASKTGAPVIAQKCGLRDGGCFQRFAKGSVHWSSKSGAHFTKANSGVQNVWKDYKWERGTLAYPINEQYGLANAPGAAGQTFQGGTVIWSSSPGGFVLTGAIEKKWKSLGWARSALKLPRTAQKCGLVKDGCFQHFQGGSIHWTKKTGAHATTGAIRSAWGSQKWERGRLGYPTGAAVTTNGQTRQNFEGGYITWTKAKGATIRYY